MSPSASTVKTTELLTARARRLESPVAVAGLMYKEASDWFHVATPVSQVPMCAKVGSLVKRPWPETVMASAEASPKVTLASNWALPTTWNAELGVVVPIPTLPAASMTKGVVSEASSFTRKELPVPSLVMVKASVVAVSSAVKLEMPVVVKVEVTVRGEEKIEVALTLKLSEAWLPMLALVAERLKPDRVPETPRD